MNLEPLIEVFVRGFAAGKSLFHPYLAEKSGDLWVMRDGPGRKEPRVIEVVAYGISAAETVRQVQQLGLGKHSLCVMHETDQDFDEVRSEYKARGYRARSAEALFHHDMATIPLFESLPAVRVVGPDDIPRSQRWLKCQRPEALVYGIWEDGSDIGLGWVKSTKVIDSAWISDLFVYSDKRNKGYGRALMSSMLLGDQARGITSSVLLASAAGARVYPHLGYSKVGTLQLFHCPKTS